VIAALRQQGAAACWRLTAALGVLLAPAAHALEEVPFVTTPDHVTLQMLELAGVGPADMLIDLGSGDGRIVNVAAQRFGARGLGVELVPQLVRQSREHARRAGVEQRVEFREQDLFQTDLSEATVVTMYLLPDVNLQLRPRLLALRPGTRVVSHHYDMGDWRPDRTLTVQVPNKTVGFEKLSRLHLWTVPAQVDGLWCGSGSAARPQLRIEQRFQQFSATLVDAASQQTFAGRIEGTVLRAAADGAWPAWTLEGAQLRTPQAVFIRSADGRCATQASNVADR
jgi:hypothetical protein